MATKSKRLSTIRDLLRRNTISHQSQLLELLEVEGISTTQATLSRDLRELGVIKENSVYTILAEGENPDSDLSPLAERLNGYVHKIDRSGSVVVLHTNDANAEEVADVIDSADFLQIVGVVGSRKTLFIATRSIGEATHLAAQIRTISNKSLKERH